MYTDDDDTKEDKQENRIRRMRMEQEKSIQEADIRVLRGKIEDAKMDIRVLQKKESDIRVQIEEAERVVKKAEEELRMQEAEYQALRKKIQTLPN